MISAIIIDDEPNAIELINGYISRVPFLDCIGTFRSALEAISFLQANEVDLVFLDINMPQLSGISLLKTVPIDAKVILTTAYSEYAVESYEHNVEDYLLKPISFERFLKAITKVQKKASANGASIPQEEPDKVIYVKDGTDNFKISTKEIVYLKKSGNYITYVLRERKIMARQTIKEALNELGSPFFQIHKSFIVNRDYVSSFSSNTLDLHKTTLPIGQSFKMEVSKTLRGL